MNTASNRNVYMVTNTTIYVNYLTDFVLNFSLSASLLSANLSSNMNCFKRTQWSDS